MARRGRINTDHRADMYKRYAVYETPAPGSVLARFGACWLGWDSALGQEVPHPVVPDLDVAAITARPRAYGFHGTIKPPFRLADGQSQDTLQQALAALCAFAAPVSLEGLCCARLGRFLALVPVGDTTALADLAARVVQELDPFRAPPNAAELAKRRAARLNPAQEALLMRWGYPYVMDQFRFHMTLTGRLDADTAERAEAALAPLLEPLPLQPYKVDALTLLGEDAQGRFHQIARYPLGGENTG